MTQKLCNKVIKSGAYVFISRIFCIFWQTQCPIYKSRRAGYSYAPLHSIINVCVRRPIMAANPISATEIKSCWRQRSSLSLANNDVLLVSWWKWRTTKTAASSCHEVSYPVFCFNSFFYYGSFSRWGEIKQQQRRQLLIVDSLKDEKVLSRRRAFAERLIYRSPVMLSWGQPSISLNRMLCW